MTKQEYKEIENLLKQAGKKLDSMSKGEKTLLYSKLKSTLTQVLNSIDESDYINENIIQEREESQKNIEEIANYYNDPIICSGAFLGTVIGGIVGSNDGIQGLMTYGLLGGLVGSLAVAFIVLPIVKAQPIKTVIDKVRSYFNERERVKLENLADKIENLIGNEYKEIV